MRVAIHGLAKTGTTGLYQRLKSATLNTGKPCLYSFEPRGPKVWEAFFKRALDQVGLVSKVMLKPKYLNHESCDLFDKQIMIVRDPRDRLVSALLFKPLSRPRLASQSIDQIVEVLRNKETAPHSMSLQGLYDQMERFGLGGLNIEPVIETLRLQLSLLKQGNFHLIRYEDFVDENLGPTSAYLDLDLGSDAQETTWLDHIERSKGYGEWKNWFTVEDVDKLRPMLQPLMDALGYSDDWELPQDPSIRAEFSSSYVLKKFESRNEQVVAVQQEQVIARDAKEYEILLARAEDGRIPEIKAVARTHEHGTHFCRKDLDTALAWHEKALIFGHNKSREDAKKLFEMGARVEQPLSRPLERWSSR